MHWIQLAKDTVQWQVPMNMLMKFLDSIKYRKLLGKMNDCLILKESFTLLS